jgi:hypothetical protein
MKENNSAIYRVQRFLFSPKAKEFALNSYDVAILFVVASHLDMPEGKCFGKQVTLAERCFMSKKHFQRRSLWLYQVGLILRYMKGKLYHYELGDQIKCGFQEIEGDQWSHMHTGNGVKKPHRRPMVA